MEDSPGPAQYNPQQDLTKSRSRQAHISPSKGRDASPIRDNNPGPGTYDFSNKNIQSFTIGQQRDQIKTASLGPGEYNPVQIKARIPGVIINPSG